MKQLLIHCMNAIPEEACGLLGGRGDVATMHVAVPNVATVPSRQFLMDPDGLMRAMGMFDARGEEPVAIYHSHPKTSAVPSRVDIEQASCHNLYYLIVSFANKSLPPPTSGLGASFSGMELKAYRIESMTKKAIGVDWRSF